MSEEADILRVTDLRVAFQTPDHTTLAVRGISFRLRRGRTLALVGESGSGKSVTSYAILRLIQPPGLITGGSVVFSPKSGPPVDIAGLSDRDEALYRIRGGKISMVFQEPMTALSPVHTIGDQLTEALLIHRNISRKSADQRAVEMLTRVGIADPGRRLRQYPFEFSGGMRQRVVIAMALICEPEILIADEPTTALDVTVQAQILRLIDDLRREMGTSVLFITHDLGVVAQVADDVAVMRHGRILEKAGVRELFRNPLHPYTRELLAAAAVGAEGSAGAPGAFAGGAPVPTGWCVDEPPDFTGDPVMHPVDGTRELLLWPAGV